MYAIYDFAPSRTLGAGSVRETSPVAAVRAAVAVLNDGDLDGDLGHFDASCQRWIVGLEQPLPLADVEKGFRNSEASFHDLRLDEDVLFGDERFACARWRMRGGHVSDYLDVASSGRSIDVETCEVASSSAVVS